MDGTKERQTLSVLVDNEAGVLSQVSRLFSRKGYNIESFAVGPTDNPEISRMTIDVIADPAQADFLCNQLRKLFPVHSVKILDPKHSIRRELVLIKVHAEDSTVKSEIIQVANIFRASVIDVSVSSLTLAVIGTEDKASAMEQLLAQHGIMELARTGTVALERGTFTLDEETKEKGEFNYGKVVL